MEGECRWQNNCIRGSCRICGNEGGLRCSNCRMQFYCSKDHQLTDWPDHREICIAWKIQESPELGRYLIASKDLYPGDTIIAEDPIIWGPALHTDEIICIGCGYKNPTSTCPTCRWPSCKSTCEGLKNVNGHGIECKLLAKAKMLPRCEIILPLRILLLRPFDQKRWKTLIKLQSHEDSRGSGTEAYEEVKKLADQMSPLLSLDPESKKILPKVCGIIDVNALETNPPEGTVALYKTACLLEHSCVANTKHSFNLEINGKPSIKVEAATSVKKGDHLSINYTHALWSTRARRDHLYATKYFLCDCKRCADPTELGSHLGTLKCSCENGWVLPKDPLNQDTDWSCDKCLCVLSSAEVLEITYKLEQEVEDALAIASKEVLGNILTRLELLLHPGHQHCISIAHSLIQLLSPEDPRKSELCKRIINTTSIIDPHGVRLGLYTAVALRELATCPGENKTDLLVKAIRLLYNEPANSPGQKLSSLMEQQLIS
ncbi:protein msta [Cephus cinctus]|uniref:Protein msta n=1 Tax=Cephus cinctus TaxID=211228 RepID=A0AAJ7BVU0_CEPCN|nr:protein msta [Cephus cinctus]XP_024940973.1 protein msta [Cephus cinctus]